MKDVGGFGHFYHKGGTATGEIIGGAYPGKNAVDDTDARAAGGDKATDLGEQNDERCLAHVG